MSNDLELAQEHQASAWQRFEAASMAVGAADTERARLEETSAAAIDAERIAAENGKPTAELTARVRDAQDAVRLIGYRLTKLRGDAEMERIKSADADTVLARAELAASHEALRIAADAFEESTRATVERKREYLGALADVRAGMAVLDLDRGETYGEKNVARVVRWYLTQRLLPTELCGGRDYYGNPIESAADIRKIIGGELMPLIR